MVRQERVKVIYKGEINHENFIEYKIIIGFPTGTSETVYVDKETYERTKLG